MATFVSLINWTDQGIRNYKDSLKRADAFQQVLEQHGGTLKEILWTVGPYDIVAIAEAPDPEAFTAVLLQTGALGNVRTTTLRGFNRDEFSGILSKSG
jgi:uncharacterized protein with GYD domain